MTASQAPAATWPDVARDPDDTLAWLRLVAAPGIGPVTVRLLLAAFGLPQQVFAQSVEALSSVVPRKLACAVLAAPGAALSQALAKTMAWLDQPGNHLLTLVDPRYPVRLLDLTDPPPLLYIKGDPAALARPALAIVARAMPRHRARPMRKRSAGLSRRRARPWCRGWRWAWMPPPMKAVWRVQVERSR